MRRKVLFISHELLVSHLDIPVSFNTDILTNEITKLIMSLVAERAEWVTASGDVVSVSDGIPHDATIVAMIRSFDRHGWSFLLEAESFPEVLEGKVSPEINPSFHLMRIP